MTRNHENRSAIDQSEIVKNGSWIPDENMKKIRKPHTATLFGGLRSKILSNS